jgi:hypothetical protein
MWKLEELKEKLKKMQLKEQTISAIPPRRKLTRESAKAPPYVGPPYTCRNCSVATKKEGLCDGCSTGDTTFDATGISFCRDCSVIITNLGFCDDCFEW